MIRNVVLRYETLNCYVMGPLTEKKTGRGVKEIFLKIRTGVSSILEWRQEL